MRIARGGYTIIEVIIVLAVSGAIFVSAVTLFSGKQGKTQFRQAMEDLDSYLKTQVNNVDVSLYPEAGQYGCQIVGGRPVLNSIPGGVSTNGDCIFLGKAIQAVPAGYLYSYTVLGSRLNAGNIVTDFTKANPSPASNPSSGSLIYDSYRLGASSTIAWSRVNSSDYSVPAVPPNTDLIAFYNNLQATSIATKQSVLPYGYRGFVSGGNVKSTIENSTGLNQIQSWFLCIHSGSSNQFARLSVMASSSGITTKTDYVASC